MFHGMAMIERAARLMGALDALNRQHGRGYHCNWGGRHAGQMGHARGQAHAKVHDQLGWSA